MQIDLTSLDVESLYPGFQTSGSPSASKTPSPSSSPIPDKRLKSSGSVSGLSSFKLKNVGSFFGSIKTKIGDAAGKLGGSSSATATEGAATADELEISDEEFNKWPSVSRTRRQWGPRVRSLK